MLSLEHRSRLQSWAMRKAKSMPGQQTRIHGKPDLSRIQRFIKPAATARFSAAMKRQKLLKMELRTPVPAPKNQGFFEKLPMNAAYDCSTNSSVVRPHSRLYFANISAKALQSSFDPAADFAGLIFQDALVAE